MQKVVPSIMQVRSEDAASSTPPPSGILIIVSATVRITKVTDTESRLEREWKCFSTSEKTRPITTPRISENTISIKGFKTMEIISSVPRSIALAIPKDTAKTIRPTASSSATTGSRIFVKGPFALY